MSLLTEDCGIGDGVVAEGRLIELLRVAATKKFTEGCPAVLDFLDMLGQPANPMKRLELSKQYVVASFINDRDISATLDFLSILPGHKEYSLVKFRWINPGDETPDIIYCWNQLTGLTNHRTRVGRMFWTIPQELMKPLYDEFSTYMTRRYDF